MTVFRNTIEGFGDLYLEISEAYAKTGNQMCALPLLESLLSSSEYNKAAVWLLYGECLARANRLEEAADAYKQVNIDLFLAMKELNFFFIR